jgi:hypothetical protein
MSGAIAVILLLILAVGVVAIYKKIAGFMEKVGTLNPAKRNTHLVPVVRMLEREGFFAKPQFQAELVLIKNEFISTMITKAATDPSFGWELAKYELLVREYPESTEYGFLLCSRSHAIGFNWLHK